MSNEEAILERLEGIEQRLDDMHAAQSGLRELKQDLQPILKDSVNVFMQELGTIETGFQLEDVLELVKRMLLSVKHMTYSLEKLEDIIDLWNTMEPLLKVSVPKLIQYLDGLEQKGVFLTYKAMLDVRTKVAQQYGPDKFEVMGDGLVFLIGLLHKLGDPKTRDLLEGLLDSVTTLELDECKECGPLGMLGAMRTKEAKQGLGVLVELTKNLGKIKQE